MGFRNNVDKEKIFLWLIGFLLVVLGLVFDNQNVLWIGFILLPTGSLADLRKSE